MFAKMAVGVKSCKVTRISVKDFAISLVVLTSRCLSDPFAVVLITNEPCSGVSTSSPSTAISRASTLRAKSSV